MNKMKTRIIVLEILLLGFGLLVHGANKKKTEKVVQKQQPTVCYRMFKDTIINIDEIGYKIYKDCWMAFSSDTVMFLFRFNETGVCDTFRVKGNFDIDKDTVVPLNAKQCAAKCNLKVKRSVIHELTDNDSVSTKIWDSLCVKLPTGFSDTISLYIPAQDNPICLLRDTVISNGKMTLGEKNPVFVVIVGKSIPSYFVSIPIEENVSFMSNNSGGKKNRCWLLVMPVLLGAAAGGVLVYFITKGKKKSEEKEEEHDEAMDENNDKSEKETEKLNSTIMALKKDIETISEKKEEEFKKEREKLKGTIENLKSDMEKIANTKEEEYRKEREKLNNTIEELKKNKEEAVARKEKEFEKEKEKLNGRIDALKEEKEKAINKKEEEFNKERKKLKDEIDEKAKRVKAIETEVRNEMQKKVDEVNGKLDKTASELSSTKKDLDATSADLKKTKNDLANEQETVAALKETQRQYTEKIVITPWAAQYATKVLSLTDLCKRIQEASKKLMEVDVEDNYFIIKAIAQYDLNVGEVDLQRFYTDLYMAANKQMAFVDSGIANLATVESQQQPRALRQYFLSAYLEKYINAIVVLNESLAGLHRLVSDMPATETAPFVQYRNELEKCFGELGIKVISVKLFDKITNNVDVKAEEVDFDDGIPADSILEIRNCIVYAVDGSRPNEKIYVKSQK